MYFTGKFVLDIAEFARSRGVEPAEVIAATGCSVHDLSQHESLVDYEQITTVFRIIKTRLASTCFGLLMGEELDLRATRYIDELMQTCTDIKEAFNFAVAYSRLISDSMECTLEMERNTFRVNFALNPEWAVQDEYVIRQNLDMALICTKNALHKLTHREFFPMEVAFYYAKPKVLKEYYRLFNCRLRFNATISSITFHRPILNERTIGISAPGNLRNRLRVQADQLLRSLPQEDGLIYQVKKVIIRNTTPLPLTIASVASELKMTTRTLQRQLKARNTNFKQLHNKIRFQLTKKMLHQGHVNLDEMAYLLGYSESSALIRAFKSWAGQSPRQYSSVIRSNIPMD